MYNTRNISKSVLVCLECVNHIVKESTLDVSSCIITWVYISCRIMHDMMI